MDQFYNDELTLAEVDLLYPGAAVALSHMFRGYSRATLLDVRYYFSINAEGQLVGCIRWLRADAEMVWQNNAWTSCKTTDDTKFYPRSG